MWGDVTPHDPPGTPQFFRGGIYVVVPRGLAHESELREHSPLLVHVHTSFKIISLK